MILSASRRTDIPAFYTPWLMNRLREGYVFVRNPMNYHQVSKVSLHPSVIDCIVFWTKNPAPLLSYLEEIGSRYSYYFQFTLNAYDHDVEPGLPSLNKRIETFTALAEITGPKAAIWRYDPILLSDKYTVDWHKEQYGLIAEALQGSAERCVISFVDLYEKVKKNLTGINARECLTDEMETLGMAFSEAAKKNGFILQTCAEKVDIGKYGIVHGSCVDANLISQITGWTINAKKDPNQRTECGCMESIDIGQYNTCLHGCKYCYATFNPRNVITLSSRHDPMSPFLIGGSDREDKITERKMKSLKKEPAGQISMF